MKDPQLSGIAKALAAHGRKGDTELIHVSKDELKTLEKYGDQLGIHLTTNPSTGLPEAFNWGGMLGSVGLPLLLTVASGGTLGPLALAMAGAAGGAGGTMLGGGSTDEALMSGVMGGIGGFGMGSVASGLASAGTAAAEQAATQTAIQAGTDVAAQTAVQAGTDAATQSAMQAGTDAAAQSTLQGLVQQSAQMPSSLLPQTGAMLAEGATPAAGSVVNGAFVPTAAPLQSTPMTGLQAMGKGWEAVTASPEAFGNFAWDNAKNIGMTGIGALGAGTSLNPQEQAITTEPDTSNPYKGEMYMDPATGQMRSRAVRRAAGGDVFGDYDDVEGGGYAVGGGIGALGSYSDGGRTLRGPGDGVSDSIPASIEGKRPARLADGEFVIPARAVSELGNGSTEAGSKQLYAMLDRIAAKRKKGKGLAYQANPKKLMPA